MQVLRRQWLICRFLLGLMVFASLAPVMSQWLRSQEPISWQDICTVRNTPATPTDTGATKPGHAMGGHLDACGYCTLFADLPPLLNTHVLQMADIVIATQQAVLAFRVAARRLLHEPAFPRAPPFFPGSTDIS